MTCAYVASYIYFSQCHGDIDHQFLRSIASVACAALFCALGSTKIGRSWQHQNWKVVDLYI